MTEDQEDDGLIRICPTEEFAICSNPDEKDCNNCDLKKRLKLKPVRPFSVFTGSD
jgi:hypothetical protein